MAKDPTYPKYAQDFIMDTMFLTDAQTCAYAKLEALCWVKEDLSIEEANKVHPLCEEIAMKFPEKFLIENGKITCKSHEETKAFRAQKKNNGTKGGRPKNQKHNQNNNQDINQNTNQDNNQKHNPSIEIEIEDEIEKEYEVEEEKRGVGKKTKLDHEIDEVLNHFIAVTGKQIEIDRESNRKFVKARLKDKIPIEDLKKIIDIKTFKWKDDPKMREYIRIETLFNETKCNSYLTEVRDLEANPELIKKTYDYVKFGIKGQSEMALRKEQLLRGI